MGVLLLWQKHLCSELIDSPMRLEMFCVRLCSGRQSTSIFGSGVIDAGKNKSCKHLTHIAHGIALFASVNMNKQWTSISALHCQP